MPRKRAVMLCRQKKRTANSQMMSQQTSTHSKGFQSVQRIAGRKGRDDEEDDQQTAMIVASRRSARRRLSTTSSAVDESRAAYRGRNEARASADGHGLNQQRACQRDRPSILTARKDPQYDVEQQHSHGEVTKQA
jgi:hypothetical protein